MIKKKIKKNGKHERELPWKVECACTVHIHWQAYIYIYIYICINIYTAYCKIIYTGISVAQNEKSFWRSDVCEDATGQQLHLESSREFVGPLVRFVLELKDMHRLEVVGVS